MVGASEEIVKLGTGISRRAFMAGAASVAAVTVLPLATAERAAALIGGPGLLKRSSFTPLLNAPFQMLDKSGRTVTVVLSQINDLKGARSPGSDSRFGLVFDGPLTPALFQGTYRFSHPRIGTFALFVVPVGRPINARHYEAVIYQK